MAATGPTNDETRSFERELVANWEHRANRALRLHQAIGLVAIAFGVTYPIVQQKIRVIESLSVVIILLAVAWTTKRLTEQFCRWVLFQTDSTNEQLVDSSGLIRTLSTSNAEQTRAITGQLLLYRHAFFSLSWLATLPILTLVPSITSVNEVILLVLAANLLRLVFFKLAEEIVLRVSVKSNSMQPAEPVVKSIDRDELSANTILDADSLLDTAKTVLVKEPKTSEWPPIVWGELPIRDKVACNHFFIHGSSGSGKSVVFKDLMIQALERMKYQSDQRMFINDPKGDMIPFLDEMGYHDYAIINPFDVNGHAWDLQKDLASKTQIEDFLELLYPSENVHQPYFPRSASGAVGVVMNYFKSNAKSWSMRDVILAFRRHDLFFSIAEKTKEGRNWIENQESGGTAFANVMSEIANGLGRFESLAAAWDAAEQEGKTFSIDEFSNRLDGKKILLLSSDSKATKSTDLLCRFLFFVQVKHIESWPEVDSPRTWVFIDEALSIAKIPQFSDITDKGRSKGLTICLATQSYNDFEEEARRNKCNSATACERIANKALLRCQGKDTEWASKQFDKVFKRYQTRSDSTNFGEHHSSSVSSTEHYQQMDAVPASYFKEMPSASVDKGVEMMVVSDPDIAGGFWHANMKIRTPKPKSRDYTRRSENVLESIRPWKRDDLERLGISDLDWILDDESDGADPIDTAPVFDGSIDADSFDAIADPHDDEPDGHGGKTIFVPGRDF